LHEIKSNRFIVNRRENNMSLFHAISDFKLNKEYDL